MYIIKDKYRNKKNNKQFNRLIKIYHKKQKEIAKIIGVGDTYISQLANGEPVSKLCAYSVCKVLSPDLEIADLFKNIE